MVNQTKAIMVNDEATEQNLRRLLSGEIGLEQFFGADGLGDPTSEESANDLAHQARILHILNITYKVVQHERIILRALEMIGKKGNILYIPCEDPTCPYIQAVIQTGRLLTPAEYASMLSSFTGLEILFQQAVAVNDRDQLNKIVEKAKDLLPNKALVLARMNDYSYDRVLREFIESSGSMELVDIDTFVEYVANQVPELEARNECSLQLSRELVTLDQLLSIGELQRTPKNRENRVKAIIDTAPKYHFVFENNLRSKVFYDAYPDKFPMESITGPLIKWKCEGECMECSNWKRTLVKRGRSYDHL